MGLRDGQGTLTYRASHAHPDWATNRQGYGFRPAATSADGVKVEVLKYPDGMVEVNATDPAGDRAAFRVPMPKLVGPTGLLVVVTWDLGAVNLLLNGVPVATVTLPPPGGR